MSIVQASRQVLGSNVPYTTLVPLSQTYAIRPLDRPGDPFVTVMQVGKVGSSKTHEGNNSYNKRRIQITATGRLYETVTAILVQVNKVLLAYSGMQSGYYIAGFEDIGYRDVVDPTTELFAPSADFYVEYIQP